MNFQFYKKNKIKNLKDIEKEDKRNFKQKAIIMGILICICITFFSGISLGKVIHDVQIKTSAEIAKPVLEVEKDSEIVITEENKKGEFSFKVKNYNDWEEVSEVPLKYYIEILEENLDKSIQYQLYKEEKEIKLTDNKTEEFMIEKDKKEEQIYTLKIQYDTTKNTVGDIMKEIQIKVHSEQLKI